MTLGDFEILPGVVIDNEDPMNQYRVKACSPGLFDTSTMDKEDMFWINPFMMFGQQSMSKLEINSKIWILHNVHNYFEYWYIPMFEINADNPGVADSNSDIMMSRSISGTKVQMYYSPSSGYSLVIGDNRLQLSSEGDFTVLANGAIISATKNGVALVQNEAEETYSAVKGEKLTELLYSFCADMEPVIASLASIPFTAPVASSLQTAVINFKTNIDSIKSEFVKIS